MSDTNDMRAMTRDINAFNEKLIEEFRANNGKVTGMFADSPLVLITHIGAKSGERRTSPLVYSLDAGRVVIIASKGGSPKDPHWYLNMKANPRVTVELPGETYEAMAVEATGAERDRLFRAQADQMPNFDEYAAKTSRVIPVIVLERI